MTHTPPHESDTANELQRRNPEVVHINHAEDKALGIVRGKIDDMARRDRRQRLIGYRQEKGQPMVKE